MTIREATAQLESEKYSNEDLIALFEYYSESRKESWRSSEEKDSARMYAIALNNLILDRMNHPQKEGKQ